MTFPLEGEFLREAEIAMRQAIEQKHKVPYAELAIDCWAEIVSVIQAADECRRHAPANNWAFQEYEDDLNEALQNLDAQTVKTRKGKAQ